MADRGSGRDVCMSTAQWLPGQFPCGERWARGARECSPTYCPSCRALFGGCSRVPRRGSGHRGIGRHGKTIENHIKRLAGRRHFLPGREIFRRRFGPLTAALCSGTARPFPGRSRVSLAYQMRALSLFMVGVSLRTTRFLETFRSAEIAVRPSFTVSRCIVLRGC